MSVYYINGETMSGIADAVRNMSGEKGLLTPAQIQTKIEQAKLGIPINERTNSTPTPWVRPNDWYDIDALAEQIQGDQDCVYLTYDLRKTPGYGWIGIFAVTADKSAWTADRGHIENGQFVSDETITTPSNNYLRQDLDSSNGDVQLWRITSTGHITQIGFVPNTGTTAQNKQNNMQPCVQRAGTLPWCLKYGGAAGTTYSQTCAITVWMERDALVPGKLAVVKDISYYWYNGSALRSIDVSKWDTSNWNITNMSFCFANCYLLQNVDLSKWDTENWAVTNMQACWNSCINLIELDLESWDTSNWAVTNISSAWSYCGCLEKLKISTWDTSNWAISLLTSTWYGCCYLKELDISTWNTSNWAVTSLNATWQGCESLTSIPIENWNTSNWAVTTLYNMFRGCYSLLSLDLSKWDTENWVVTTIGDMFSSCYSLQKLSIPFDTSNWAVTTMTECFASCFSLTTIDLNDWDTSEWAVTSLASLCSGCYSLEHIYMDKFDTSDWAVTTLLSMFANCWSLQDLSIENWDTSNWEVTTLSGMFNLCRSLTSVDLSSWDTSNWNVTTISSMFTDCRKLKSININTWDTSNWQLTGMYNICAYCYSLESFNIGSWDTTNWDLQDDRSIIGGANNIKELYVPADMKLNATKNNTNGSPNQSGLITYLGTKKYKSHTYSGAIKLTVASLVSIIDRLATVSTTQTLTLGQSNKLKLTAEQIAVATQKGWTVA